MNRIVVITGASSGIGLAMKEKFEAAGDIVVSCQRNNPNLTDDSNFDKSSIDGNSDKSSDSNLDKSSIDSHFIKCDVTSEAEVSAAAKLIAEKYGRVDILINNAGIGISGATELVPMENIIKAMDISYFGSLYVTRAMLPLMKAGGRIIFMSSVAGLFALPFRSVYNSVKAAQLMLGEALRMELSDAGIKVVTICPGEIKTNFTANKLSDTSTNERYGDRPARALNKVNSREEKRMMLSDVSEKMYKICVRGRKARYIIGRKYKMLWILKKIIPNDLYLKFTNKYLG